MIFCTQKDGTGTQLLWFGSYNLASRVDDSCQPSSVFSRRAVTAEDVYCSDFGRQMRVDKDCLFGAATNCCRDWRQDAGKRGLECACVQLYIFHNSQYDVRREL